MASQRYEDQRVPDQCLQPNGRAHKGDEHCHCVSTKQHETRSWDRTVFVPDGWEPTDIIENYAYEFPFPRFHAGHMVNKRDVECIASAMLDPHLRWSKMCHFLVAPYELPPGTPNEPDRLGFSPHDHVGDLVLISGHHRFLAYLLCGLPHSELPSIHVRTAPISVPYMFPWSTVQWSK